MFVPVPEPLGTQETTGSDRLPEAAAEPQLPGAGIRGPRLLAAMTPSAPVWPRRDGDPESCSTTAPPFANGLPH
jgi:hypothetical protein